MIEIKKGYIAYNILYVLSLTNCFPVYSLHILGNKRIYNSTIKEMKEKQVYYNCETKEKIECKALNITGRGREKIISLSIKALPLLEWIGMDKIYDPSKTRTGNKNTIDRLCRKAEVLGFFYRAGMFDLSAYLAEGSENTSSDLLYFNAKKLLSEQIDCRSEIVYSEGNQKTAFTRVVGVLMDKDRFFPVYNIRDRAMKWVGDSEQKAKASLSFRAKTNSNVDNIKTILLFGKKYEAGMTTVETGWNTTPNNYPRKSFNLSGVYSKIHFVPYDAFGQDLLRFILADHSTELLLQTIFQNNNNNGVRGAYDLVLNSGEFVYSFCDSDLSRFSKILKLKPEYVGRMIIVCFEEQVEFLQSQFAPGEVLIQSVDIREALDYLKSKGVIT